MKIIITNRNKILMVDKIISILFRGETIVAQISNTNRETDYIYLTYNSEAYENIIMFLADEKMKILDLREGK